MPEKSPPQILKKILKNIADIQTFVDTCKSLKLTLDAGDFDRKDDSTALIEKTKHIVEDLKKTVGEIEGNFNDFYESWQRDHGTQEVNLENTVIEDSLQSDNGKGNGEKCNAVNSCSSEYIEEVGVKVIDSDTVSSNIVEADRTNDEGCSVNMVTTKEIIETCVNEGHTEVSNKNSNMGDISVTDSDTVSKEQSESIINGSDENSTSKEGNSDKVSESTGVPACENEAAFRSNDKVDDENCVQSNLNGAEELVKDAEMTDVTKDKSKRLEKDTVDNDVSLFSSDDDFNVDASSDKDVDLCDEGSTATNKSHKNSCAADKAKINDTCINITDDVSDGEVNSNSSKQTDKDGTKNSDNVGISKKSEQTDANETQYIISSSDEDSKCSDNESSAKRKKPEKKNATGDDSEAKDGEKNVSKTKDCKITSKAKDKSESVTCETSKTKDKNDESDVSNDNNQDARKSKESISHDRKRAHSGSDDDNSQDTDKLSHAKSATKDIRKSADCTSDGVDAKDSDEVDDAVKTDHKSALKKIERKSKITKITDGTSDEDDVKDSDDADKVDKTKHKKTHSKSHKQKTNLTIDDDNTGTGYSEDQAESKKKSVDATSNCKATNDGKASDEADDVNKTKHKKASGKAHEKESRVRDGTSDDEAGDTNKMKHKKVSTKSHKNTSKTDSHEDNSKDSDESRTKGNSESKKKGSVDRGDDDNSKDSDESHTKGKSKSKKKGTVDHGDEDNSKDSDESCTKGTSESKKKGTVDRGDDDKSKDSDESHTKGKSKSKKKGTVDHGDEDNSKDSDESRTKGTSESKKKGTVDRGDDDNSKDSDVSHNKGNSRNKTKGTVDRGDDDNSKDNDESHTKGDSESKKKGTIDRGDDDNSKDSDESHTKGDLQSKKKDTVDHRDATDAEDERNHANDKPKTNSKTKDRSKDETNVSNGKIKDITKTKDKSKGKKNCDSDSNSDGDVKTSEKTKSKTNDKRKNSDSDSDSGGDAKTSEKTKSKTNDKRKNSDSDSDSDGDAETSKKTKSKTNDKRNKSTSDATCTTEEDKAKNSVASGEAQECTTKDKSHKKMVNNDISDRDGVSDGDKETGTKCKRAKPKGRTKKSTNDTNSGSGDDDDPTSKRNDKGKSSDDAAKDSDCSTGKAKDKKIVDISSEDTDQSDNVKSKKSTKKSRKTKSKSSDMSSEDGETERSKCKGKTKNNRGSSDEDTPATKRKDKKDKNKRADSVSDDDNTKKKDTETNQNNINDSTNEDSVKNETVELKREQPVFKIKCVDITKLMDPNILSNSRNASASVPESIVISDSDAEVSAEDTKLEPTRSNAPANSTPSQPNKVIVLDDSDSDVNTSGRKSSRLRRAERSAKVQKRKSVRFNVESESSDRSERRNKRLRGGLRESVRARQGKINYASSDEETNRRTLRRRDNKTKRKNLVDVSSLSDNSTSSDSDDVGSVRSRPKLSKQKGKRELTKALVNTLLSAQDDKKFSCKVYVSLVRIPAEKLKKIYEKKLLKETVKRLTNMDSLKRSRKDRKNSNSSSESTDSQESQKKRPCRKSSSKDKSEAGPGSDGVSSDECVNDKNPPDTSEGVNVKEPTVQQNKVAENDLAVKLLSEIRSGSDSSDHNAGSDAKDSDGEKEKEDDSRKRNKDKTKVRKDKNKSGSESEKEMDKNSGSDSEDKKKKKKWRKDKLLTEKMSESDSDENFTKFLKKKEKKAEEQSDSEAVTSKKKTKRTKRKANKRVLGSDSDSSASGKYSDDESSKKSSDSSDSEKEKEEKKSTKRRRIKKLQDSSSDDDDKSTRKHIRKVWANDSLAESTIQAEKEEKERKARVAEKQKKYNQIFESDQLEKATVDKVVLDFDEESKKELLKVNKYIVKNLKPHQAKGIQFMWDACFESLERAKSTDGSGCILAHCMGLGKTLQVIALIHTLITKEKKTGVTKVMVVCPLSTVLNWVAEFKKWMPDEDEFEVFELVSFKQNFERQYQVQEWYRCGGVIILGYDMFRNLTHTPNRRMSKKVKATFQTSLVDPGPDVVICDEGHLLKNEKTSISIAMNKLRTKRRIILTGTPLQNNLKEYFCMIQFVKPNLLGNYREYTNRFVNPITNGQYTDSTQHDIQIMRKRSHVLHKLLDGVVQRKDYSVLAPFLPPKHEYVLFISLSDVQIKLYQFYLKERSRRSTEASNKSSYIFADFQELQRICTHPRVLLDKSNEVKLAKEKMDDDEEEESEGSLKDFIDDEDEAKSTSSDSNSVNSSDSGQKKQQRKRLTRANADQVLEEPEVEVQAEPEPQEWWQQFCEGDELDNVVHSGKLFLLFEILHECELMGDKVLVFSQSLYSLNVIEYFLRKVDEETQDGDPTKIGAHPGSWSLGLDYFRLDGSSSCDNRASWCKTFNDPQNVRARLFLISTKAGGLGINLVAANRVIIFDVSWNPSHDIQSIYRVYRFGQTKPSYIYRFVTLGTMEMKIYERQVIKQAISKRVIDEQQIDRHYNQTDLAELYNFDPKPEGDRPIPLVPKDVLLGELLQDFEKSKIYKYHEHQSLLENKEDECLDEEERKAAWEEFENEKKARMITQSSSGKLHDIPFSLVTRALTSIVQKDNPAWDAATVQSVVPQLVQELQEQIALGNTTMYVRIISEIRIMQSLQQQQKLQDFYRQTQAMMMRNYQQQLLNNPNATPQLMQQLNNPYPRGTGSSMARNPLANRSNPPEIIDLND